MAETARVQCVFLDTVGFTRNRSIEAQSDIVATLNGVVTGALEGLAIAQQDVVLLPTGDGMAIALIEAPGVDVHLRLALAILRLIAEHNAVESDAMRQFEVRIGINENIDNLVVDVNAQRNVAGAGIATAQRIMDKADGGQILVGQTVFEVLRQREKYMPSFRRFRARDKHGLEFDLFQYVKTDVQGLDVAVPSAFARKPSERPELSQFIAYYMSHALANQSFLAAKKGDAMRDYIAVVLLEFLADDSVAATHTPPHEEPMIRTWGNGSASFEEQYNHYHETDFWTVCEFSRMVEHHRLSPYSACFEADRMPNYGFVSKIGLERLLAEAPEIAQEFGIEAPPKS